MRTSSNSCCGNEAGLVEKFIGSAYDVVKSVADNLEDIKGLYDLLNKYGMVVAVDDANKVAALPVLSRFARVYTYSKTQQRGVYTDYLYVPDNKSGIIPDDPKATGSWVIVYSSESGGELETTYIPWVYNNGSAFGDETEIHVPDNTIGVPFIYINGSFQLVGYGYTYNPGTYVVTLSEPLNIKDEVVLMLSGLPAVPDNPNVSDFTIINWLYKNGSAVGGETVIHPPFTFQHVPAVFINGLRKVQPLDYTVNLDTYDINLKASLKPGDTVVVQLGGELNTFQVDSSIGFEALRRTYAETGMNLVNGSFEEGALLTNSQDVLLQRSTGKCFNWQATLPVDGKVIPANSTPASTGGIGIGKWQEVTGVTQYSQAQYSDGINYKTYCAWQEQVTIQHKDEAVQFKQGGVFYRWDGAFPQGGLSIPQGTPEPVPSQTGAGKYIAILDLEAKNYVLSRIGNPNSLINPNFAVPSPDSSIVRPSSSPTDYPPGAQVFLGWYADTELGARGLTFTSGRLTITSGALYQDVVTSVPGAVPFVASIAKVDLSPIVELVSGIRTGNTIRVKIGAATDIYSCKLEPGMKATMHTPAVGGYNAFASMDLSLFGAVPTTRNDPDIIPADAAISAALKWSAASGAEVIISGAVGITTGVDHPPKAKVRFCGGMLVPIVERWVPKDYPGYGDYMYSMEDDTLKPSLYDRVGGYTQYFEPARTWVDGLFIMPQGGGDLSSGTEAYKQIKALNAVGFLGKSAGLARITNARIYGANFGGYYLVSGGGWNLHNFESSAPPTRSSTSRGLFIASSDNQISSGTNKFYPIGTEITKDGSANTLIDVHNWGFTTADYASQWHMNFGFIVDGGYNELISCYADSNTKIDQSKPPSIENGAIGFLIGRDGSTGFDNVLTNCKSLSHHVNGNQYGAGYWLNNNATLVGCRNNNVDGVLNGYHLKISGNAKRAGTAVYGGNVTGDFANFRGFTPEFRADNGNNPIVTYTNRYYVHNIDRARVEGVIKLEGTLTKSGSPESPVFVTLPDWLEYESAFGRNILSPTPIFRSVFANSNVYAVVSYVQGNKVYFQSLGRDGAVERLNQSHMANGSFYIELSFTANIQ